MNEEKNKPELTENEGSTRSAEPQKLTDDELSAVVGGMDRVLQNVREKELEAPYGTSAAPDRSSLRKEIEVLIKQTGEACAQIAK